MPCRTVCSHLVGCVCSGAERRSRGSSVGTEGEQKVCPSKRGGNSKKESLHTMLEFRVSNGSQISILLMEIYLQLFKSSLAVRGMPP